MSNKRKNNASFKGKQRDNVNKAKPPCTCTFSCCCRNLKFKKTIGGKSTGGGGAKALRFLSQLRPRIHPQVYEQSEIACEFLARVLLANRQKDDQYCNLASFF